MLRTSSYTIYVPLAETEDEMLLVHGYSGAYDKVTRRLAQYLLDNETAPPSKPLHGEWGTEPAARALLERAAPEDAYAPSGDTLELLRRRGYLTAMTPDEEEGHFARTVKQLHEHKRQAAASYLFMPTYQCNLRCPYCFQDHMRTDPAYKHLLQVMDRDMVDRIFASFPTLEASHAGSGTSARTIGFYGGEPLLAQNRDIIEYIMQRARDMGPTRFWAVSNATELEAYEDLLGPDGIAMVQITLDGPPAEHDKRRIRPDGSGSFAEIARNITRCLEWGVQVSVRMNMDRDNIVHVPWLAEEIVSQGWDQHRNFSVYTARVVAGHELTKLSNTFATTWDLDQAIDELRKVHPAMAVIGRPDDGMQARARQLLGSAAHGWSQAKSSFCSAHTSMYIFDSFGDIYACWDRTGEERLRIGRVLEDGVVEMNDGMNRMWRSRTPATNPTCRKCRYALSCGGGCAVLAEGQKGKFYTNYCDGFAERFRHSVAEAYREHITNAEQRVQVRVCDL